MHIEYGFREWERTKAQMAANFLNAVGLQFVGEAHSLPYADYRLGGPSDGFDIADCFHGALGSAPGYMDFFPSISPFLRYGHIWES